jgi:hypothetical protein
MSHTISSCTAAERLLESLAAATRWHCSETSAADRHALPCVAVAPSLLQNGYWKRWQLLRGGSADGAIEWEETWWDASDYTGLKEMGAQKQGECMTVSA